MHDITGVILAAGKGSRMKSNLPKVLHKVNGTPMVTCCVNALHGAGIDTITVVVGYRKELIQAELGDRVGYAVQEHQRGTGDAVAAASEAIAKHGGRIVIVYGDNPLLSSATIRKLAQAAEPDDCAGAVLTITLDNPPIAGRIIRDSSGAFARVVEEQDCSPEQKKIKEVNVGTYCFKAEPLLAALDQLKPNNNQGEYYLTDVPHHLVDMGHRVQTVEASDLFETLGVNDPHHLRFAEMAKDIGFAESLYPIIDAATSMSKAKG